MLLDVVKGRLKVVVIKWHKQNIIFGYVIIVKNNYQKILWDNNANVEYGLMLMPSQINSPSASANAESLIADKQNPQKDDKLIFIKINHNEKDVLWKYDNCYINVKDGFREKMRNNVQYKI